MDRPDRRRSRIVIVAIVAVLTAGCTSTLGPPAGTAIDAGAQAPDAVAASPTPSHTAAPTATPTPERQARDPAAFVAGAPYSVVIDPADFVAVVDNPYWPMTPGTTTIFEGDGERIVVEVTDYTKVIMGVAVTVVRDRVYEDGSLVEDTLDWYAQDRWGNVWYFGEEVVDYEDGKPVSTAGSWEAGVDGALPGIVMLAEPQVGDVYRNEFYAGEAEDLARVVEMGGTIDVPAGAFADTLLTEDWTPLEPDQLERKTYAPGVGLVAEGPVDEPTIVQLVEVRRP